MQLDFAQRHHVDSEETLNILETYIPKLTKTKELTKKHNIKHSLILSTNLTNITNSQEEKLQSIVKQLRNNKITVQYEHQLPAGAKFTQQQFFKVSKDIKGIADLDQFPIEEESQLQAIIELATKLVNENKLFANGSRNVPVILGKNKLANDLRTIHEIYNAMTGNFKPSQTPNWANPLPIYAEFGESTSGFYLVNPNHSEFKRILEIIDNNQELILKGFTIEYFIAILTGSLDLTTTGYIYANPNPFPSIKEDIEINSAKQRIKDTTSYFKNTEIEEVLKSTLNNKSNQQKLENYFNTKLIEEVKALMLSSL
jgi:hypothetical protein